MSPITPPTDLTKRPPRSARVRLGGYVILPRCLDKLRATLAGTVGEYHYACPLDRRFPIDFAGKVDPDARSRPRPPRAAAITNCSSGSGRTPNTSAPNPKSPPGAPMRITARPTMSTDASSSANSTRPRIQKREDIATWFDVLDLDDYVTFGGKA